MNTKKKEKITRREFFKNSAKFGVSAIGGISLLSHSKLGYSQAPAKKLEKMTIKLGYQPYAATVGPICNYMEQERVFAKYAQEYGYEVTDTFVPLLSGPVINEGLLAKKLEFGDVGPYPTMSMLASGGPIYIIAMAEGHGDHAILVRPNSPIKNLDDLIKRKSVIGIVIGSSSHQFVENVFRLHYGKGAKELGVVLTDMPLPSQTTFPAGVDAVIPWTPTSFLMESKGLGVRLLGLNGKTGKAHELGEGKYLPGFEKGWGYPEGYVIHRAYWLVSRDIADEHPKLIVAFLRALQETTYKLFRDKERAFELSKNWWKLPKEIAMAVINEDTILGPRDWIWLTEGDLSPLVITSKWLFPRGAVKRVVTWDIIKEYSKPRDLVKQAYEKGTHVSPANYPSLAEMTRKDLVDVRGYPVWMVEKWRLTD